MIGPEDLEASAAATRYLAMTFNLIPVAGSDSTLLNRHASWVLSAMVLHKPMMATAYGLICHLGFLVLLFRLLANTIHGWPASCCYLYCAGEGVQVLFT